MFALTPALTLVAQGRDEETCPSKQPQLRDSLIRVKTGNGRKRRAGVQLEVQKLKSKSYSQEIVWHLNPPAAINGHFTLEFFLDVDKVQKCWNVDQIKKSKGQQKRKTYSSLVCWHTLDPSSNYYFFLIQLLLKPCRWSLSLCLGWFFIMSHECMFTSHLHLQLSEACVIAAN